MAIGVEGGFALDQKKKYEYEKTHDIVILPSYKSWAIGESERKSYQICFRVLTNVLLPLI